MADQPSGLPPGLIESSIAVGDHPDADVTPLLGDWYHPGWHVRIARGEPAPDAHLRLQWVARPLRFRVTFGAHYACDGRVAGDRIEWANGGSWRKDAPLYAFESRVFSQNGEDGVTLALLQALGVDKASALEFGVEHGGECNTRILRARGGNVIQWDRDHDNPSAGVFRELVTLDNLPELVERYQVPRIARCA